MQNRLMLVPALSLMLAGAACGGSEDAPVSAEAVTRDSAGVRIVESPGPVWDQATAWRLSEEPSLDVGRLDGPEETQFFRVSAGTRLSDGSFVLGSFGSHDLRRFTADGAHLWTVGREGEGPGEFVGLTEVVAGAGDTIITYDFRQRRFSRFAPDGTFLDSRPLDGPSESGFGFVETLMPDGSAVFTWREFDQDDGPPSEGEVSRDTINIHLVEPGRESSVELGTFPGAETVVLQSGESDGGFMIAIGATPFGRSTQVAGGTSGVWLGDTDRFEIHRYDAGGDLRTVARRSWEPVVVDDALVQRATDEELAEADDDDDRRRIRRRWESVPTPETLPAFQALQVDRVGNVWVQQFEVPGAPERTWSVFDRAGTWLGDVAFPDRFRPLEIGDDYVLGRFGDELDVEHIQLWKLIKPAG
ncbi:MAG: hypothetical protein M8866_05650 [marine benthic group bacterium]|nr:hypothetical protein [Candidatus Benthicola marisminoris]